MKNVGIKHESNGCRFKARKPKAGDKIRTIVITAIKKSKLRFTHNGEEMIDQQISKYTVYGTRIKD